MFGMMLRYPCRQSRHWQSCAICRGELASVYGWCVIRELSGKKSQKVLVNAARLTKGLLGGKAVFWVGNRENYGFAPKARRRPSQSFTTNSRDFHGMLATCRVNSTPRATYSE
jgi:hypothetical protein